ncbi:MAG: hypothetical protein K9K21_06710, partial [Desulfotignum sp.]|nr:hypothetical protein [Desulfotignum sp.]
MDKKELAAVFTQKASLVSACIHEVKDRAWAIKKSLEILARKPPLDPQMASGKKRDPSERILAAPNLDHDRFLQLYDQCRAFPEIRVIRDGLR